MKMKRLYICVPVFAAAIIILFYGAGFNSTAVVTEPKTKPDQFSNLTELEIIFDTTVGGLERLETNTLARTYSGIPPSTCPT